MTAIRSYIQPRREDAPGLQPENWNVLDRMNAQLSELTRQLQGRLDETNDNADVREIELFHNTAQELSVDLRGVPQECQVIFSEVAVEAFFWEVLEEDQIRVIARFAGDSAATTQTRLVRLRIAGGSTGTGIFPATSGALTIPQEQPVQGADHGLLLGLLDDDHPQYLLLAGRAGGQSAFGGTGSGEELNLTGSTDAALGRIMINSPLEIGDVSAGDQIGFRYRPTFTASVPFVGGFQSAAADVTITNAVFIWALLAENTTYRQGVAPGFAAFTLFNALSVITNSGNFNLFAALVLNVGVVHERSTSGTSTTTQTIGMNFAPQTRALVSGAVMTRTTGLTALQVSPTFSTVTGSTVNLGTVRGMLCNAPAVALFQPQTGTENLTAYYGIDFTNITFASSGDKVVVRSAMTDATDRFFLQNNGGARSYMAASIMRWDDAGGCEFGTGNDVRLNWNGSQFEFAFAAFSDDLRFSNPANTRFLIEGNAGNGDGGDEFNFSCHQFSLGAQTTAVGNQVGIFAAGARTVGLAGEWADFLLTQGANLDINGLAMSNVSAWVINSISITLSGGTISDVATLRIPGMTTSSLGGADTAALFVQGREHLRGSLGLDPITPAQLTADVNDYQGHGTGNSQRAVVRASSDASRNITGFDASISRDGDTIWITNVGSNDIVLQHQNAGSAAANRIISPTGADLTLNADESALLWYDPTDTRWRIFYTTGA